MARLAGLLPFRLQNRPRLRIRRGEEVQRHLPGRGLGAGADQRGVAEAVGRDLRRRASPWLVPAFGAKA